MIKEVIQKGNPILRTKCKKVADFEAAKKIIRDLEDTIDYLKTTYDFSRGIGLAAPQIGETVKIAIVENCGKKHVMVNPKIIENSGEKREIWEGCISFFDYRANVPRYTWVKVRYFDIEGNEHIVDGKNGISQAFQHEIDHLNGILFFDHLPNGEKDLIKSDKA